MTTEPASIDSNAPDVIDLPEGPLADLNMLQELMAKGGAEIERLERVNADKLQRLDLFNTRYGISEYHVGSLKRTLSTCGDLEPVVVLAICDQLFIVDGHHRVEAYRRAKRTSEVPVRYFSGSPEEAVIEAHRLNGRNTLPLSNPERQNGAWKLVKLERHSLSAITNASGVSRAQVGIMRKVFRELGQNAHEYVHWFKAKKAAKGTLKSLSEEEIESMLEQQARNFADQLVKAIGMKPSARPELLARIIEHYAGRKVNQVIVELLERNPLSDDPFEMLI